MTGELPSIRPCLISTRKPSVTSLPLPIPEDCQWAHGWRLPSRGAGKCLNSMCVHRVHAHLNEPRGPAATAWKPRGSPEQFTACLQELAAGSMLLKRDAYDLRRAFLRGLLSPMRIQVRRREAGIDRIHRNSL